MTMMTKVGVIFVVGCVCSSALMLNACSRESPTGSQGQALIEAGAVTTTVRVRANSPSAVFSPAQVGRTSTTLAVGYDDFGPTSPAGWSFSNDQGMTWAPCNMIDTGAYAGCNGGPAVLATPTMAWLGKSSLAADGRGNVVYVTLASNVTTTPTLVVATLSADGGRTFGKAAGSTIIVNEQGGDCDGGVQDLPNATFDFTTEPPTLWVVWRHKAHDSFGGCVRRGQIIVPDGGTPFLQWVDSARSVGQMDKEDPFNINMGQGGLRIQAGDGVVAVAYSNNDMLLACPDGNPHTSIRWGMVTSLDNGQSWTTRSSILHTDLFQSCTFHARIQNSLRAFDFLRTNDGNYYAAINDNKTSIRLFMTPASGVRVSSGTDGVAWREFCQNTATFSGSLDAGTPPTSSWSAPGAACGHPFVGGIPSNQRNVIMPTLGGDGNDRIALTFTGALDNSNVNVIGRFVAFAAPRVPTLNAQFALATGSFTPNPTAIPAGYPVLGNYASIVTDSVPNADSCSGSGTFFPFTTVADGIVPSVVTNQISFQ